MKSLVLVIDSHQVLTPLVTIAIELEGDNFQILPVGDDGEYRGILLAMAENVERYDVERIY